jgi:hypothetical protein
LFDWLLFGSFNVPVIVEDCRFNGDLREMIASGKVDLELLGKAVLMQKVLSATGLDPEDLVLVIKFLF